MEDAASVDAEPDFDHTDPVAAQDIYGLLASSRERCPVLHGSRHGGFWALSRFADVTGAANDHEHFTTRQGVTVPPLGLPIASVPLTTDPPEHKFYRRALQPFFTPAAVAGMEDRIREVVVGRIESFASAGRADLVAELAGPVPCIVIAMVLGLDREHWPSFMAWVDGMEAASHVGDTATRQAYAAKLYDFLVSEVEQRRAAPRGDLLSAIATMTSDDAPVSDAIRYGMAQLILVAGHDTTVAGIGSLLRHLMEHPDLRARARADGTVLARVIEESLRFESPVFGLARTVSCPVTVQDRDLAPGDKVLLMFGSANHDPRRFPRSRGLRRRSRRPAAAHRLRVRRAPLHRRAPGPDRTARRGRGTAPPGT